MHGRAHHPHCRANSSLHYHAHQGALWGPHGRAHHPHCRANPSLHYQCRPGCILGSALPCASSALSCQLKLALPMQTRVHSWVRTTVRVIGTAVPTQACTTNADQGAFLGPHYRARHRHSHARSGFLKRTTMRRPRTPMRGQVFSDALPCADHALPCATRFSRKLIRFSAMHSRALLVGHSESGEHGPH